MKFLLSEEDQNRIRFLVTIVQYFVGMICFYVQLVLDCFKVLFHSCSIEGDGMAEASRVEEDINWWRV